MNENLPSIVLLGAGNVGHHLGLRFHEMGVPILQVFSRKIKKAEALAQKINAEPLNTYYNISKNAELYIIAVNDDAIGDVAKKLVNLGLSERLMVHTSGATPSTVLLQAGAKSYGVFYPLQTFSLDRQPDWQDIPICIDVNFEFDLNWLKKLAEKISNNVHHISDEQRAILHVAAVFVNNFSNHLFHIGNDILQKNNLPFNLLLPLIKETAMKLENGTPAEMQTGPAKRKDEETINRHLAFLENMHEYAAVYKLLTNGISTQNS